MKLYGEIKTSTGKVIGKGDNERLEISLYGEAKSEKARVEFRYNQDTGVYKLELLEKGLPVIKI